MDTKSYSSSECQRELSEIVRILLKCYSQSAAKGYWEKGSKGRQWSDGCTSVGVAVQSFLRDFHTVNRQNPKPKHRAIVKFPLGRRTWHQLIMECEWHCRGRPNNEVWANPWSFGLFSNLPSENDAWCALQNSLVALGLLDLSILVRPWLETTRRMC